MARDGALWSPYRTICQLCDEHDEARMQRCYDDFDRRSFRRYVVVRWNPDAYTPPLGVPYVEPRDRFAALVALLQRIVNEPQPVRFCVHYMYYDEDSPRIARTIPHMLHY